MEKKLLTKEELAQWLGLSPRSISAMVFRGRIPALQISRRCLRFDPEQIEQWLAAKANNTHLCQPCQPPKRPRGRPRKYPAIDIDKIVQQAKQEVLRGQPSQTDNQVDK